MIEHVDKIQRELAQLRRLIEAHNRGKDGDTYDASKDGTLLYVDLATEAIGAELHEVLKENRK